MRIRLGNRKRYPQADLFGWPLVDGIVPGFGKYVKWSKLVEERTRRSAAFWARRYRWRGEDAEEFVAESLLHVYRKVKGRKVTHISSIDNIIKRKGLDLIRKTERRPKSAGCDLDDDLHADILSQSEESYEESELVASLMDVAPTTVEYCRLIAEGWEHDEASWHLGVHPASMAQIVERGREKLTAFRLSVIGDQ